jgi:hypothetical protein
MINKLVKSIYFNKPVSIQTAIKAECEDSDNELLHEAGKYISTLECLSEMLLNIVRHSEMSDSDMADVLDDFIQGNESFHEQTVAEAESLLWEELA